MAPQTVVKPANVAEVMLDMEFLDTFVQALQQTGLVDRLAKGGPYTIFAPTNSAFKEYSDQTLQELLGNREELLTLISYHIVPGTFVGSYFNRPSSVRTLLGKELLIDRSHFVAPDIEAGNGIVHVIDTVLVPK